MHTKDIYVQLNKVRTDLVLSLFPEKIEFCEGQITFTRGERIHNHKLYEISYQCNEIDLAYKISYHDNVTDKPDFNMYATSKTGKRDDYYFRDFNSYHGVFSSGQILSHIQDNFAKRNGPQDEATYYTYDISVKDYVNVRASKLEAFKTAQAVLEAAEKKKKAAATRAKNKAAQKSTEKVSAYFYHKDPDSFHNSMEDLNSHQRTMMNQIGTYFFDSTEEHRYHIIIEGGNAILKLAHGDRISVPLAKIFNKVPAELVEDGYGDEEDAAE